MSTQEDERYKALNHPLRKKIIQYLAEKPRTYTELLQTLEIESGHLAYHLRNLKGLTRKDEQGYYHLNKKGVEAYNFLIGNKQEKIQQSKYFEKKAIIITVILLSIVIVATIISTNNLSNTQITELKNETNSKSLQALDIVYEIFDDWEIPRDHWTDLLLKIVEIKSGLNQLYDYTHDKSYLSYSQRLEYYEDELSKVVIAGDSNYMTLTVEKRYLIRELHSLLLEIVDSLNGL